MSVLDAELVEHLPGVGELLGPLARQRQLAGAEEQLLAPLRLSRLPAIERLQPLQAFERWKAREAEWGKKLFFETGQLSLAREWTKDLTDTRKVFDKLGVKYDVVQHDDLLRRYPQMNMQNVDFAMYTPSTGVLKAREGCVAVAQAFEKKGGRFSIAKVDLGRTFWRRHCRTSCCRPASGSPRRRSCSRAGRGCRKCFRRS